MAKEKEKKKGKKKKKKKKKKERKKERNTLTRRSPSAGKDRQPGERRLQQSP